ncbi:MAG: hypothetical protein PHI34_00760 [Acidobacteriota bacterium]|nr:hypothetical protein [Acidobacteriota bacterium]
MPIPLFINRRLGFGGKGSSKDSLQGIIRGAKRMSGDMGRRCRLTRGPGGGASRVILTDFASGGMSRQRSLAYVGHPEHPGMDPGLERLDRISGAMVPRIFFLKIRQNTFDAIDGPDGQGSGVGFSNELDEGRVLARKRKPGIFIRRFRFHFNKPVRYPGLKPALIRSANEDCNPVVEPPGRKPSPEYLSG